MNVPTFMQTQTTISNFLNEAAAGRSARLVFASVEMTG
jgi:hypothetical protein